MKWEHKVHVQWFGGHTRQGQAKKIADLCNTYGQDDWQLCAIQRGDILGIWGFDLVFKRPLEVEE